jgi:hypothetical protein
VGWVKEKLSEVSESEDPDAEPEKSQLQQIEEMLAANIEGQIHPTSQSGLPWAPTEDEFSEESAE